MESLFRPASAVSERLGARAAFAIVGALFLASTVVALLGRGGAVSWIEAVGLALAALYGLAALSQTASDTSFAQEVVERIASGDLTVRATSGDAASPAKGGALARSVARMGRSLLDIVNQVVTSAESIQRLAKEMAKDSSQLSQRTQEQASSLQQTAAGIQQISANVRQNADHCRKASAVAATASGVATRAAARRGAMTVTMEQIAESSRRVADIVGTIEGIAFQTNILALNAAVEAARAGEQGRGFAVVATEVRDLAQRAAGAAQEVRTLIEASVGQVAQGAVLVNEAGATMTDVVVHVRQVSDLIAEVAAASSEQITGVEDIDKAIARMDAFTQENAELVDRTATAAYTFEDEAGRLGAVVGAFKVDRGEDRDRAIRLVQRAVAHVHERGFERACDDFNDPRGPFTDRNYYIWGATFDGVIVANGSTPDARGQNHLGIKAADGRRFIQEIVDVAKTKGKGWCDYPWKNPVTGRTEQKSTYFEAVEGAFLACGIYRGKRADVPPRAAPRPETPAPRVAALARTAP